MDPITSRTSKPFIHPNEVQPDEKLKPLTQAEEVLNWQSENMVSQNEIFQSLDKRVDKTAEKIDETNDNLKVLSQKINAFSFLPTYVSSPPDQVRYIPTAYRPKSTRTSTPSTSKTKGKAPCLSASSSDSQDIPETSPPKIQKEEETPDKGFQAMAITRKYESSQENHHLTETSAHKEDESSTDSDNNSDQETSTDKTPRSVSSKSESEDNYMPRLFMANIQEEDSFFEEESPEETLIPERIKPNGGPWFTFDDIPPSRWRKRLLEFGAWLDTQMMKTSAYNYKIIEEFCCRMTGTMKEWYHNLGTFKQDELHRLETTANILGVFHREFIGDMEMFDRKNRQEFFEMKCCSLKTKDLDRHYHRMAQRYYVLNGYNDPSLKNTYVSSLPQELQPEIHRMLATTQRDIKTTSLGQIHQVTIEALEKLCSFHHQFSEVIEQNSKFTHACRKPYLEIKCKDKRCSCATKKKHHQQKYTKSHRTFKGKKRKNMKFFRRKPFRGKGKNERCFICGKKGHFSKECPNNTHKAAKLINSLKPLEGDLESLYSEQSSADEETIFALQDSSPDEASSSESEDDKYLPVYSFKEIESSLPTPPLPCVEVHVLATKFSRPKKVIAYMDTGAQITMTNPSYLLVESWTASSGPESLAVIFQTKIL
ncbi:hypothetical protein KIW84_051178 [Lathyrus oleraceus]|uniref:CCHC-type domain-containing protein n=1 Tax=Pisum sativum TaxID=3888 RepID=A0A9D5AD90_PEA|nr:hypothetical protein KIW84_051178 [Pisum sativum]